MMVAEINNPTVPSAPKVIPEACVSETTGSVDRTVRRTCMRAVNPDRSAAVPPGFHVNDRSNVAP